MNRSELVSLYHRAVDAVARFNYPDDRDFLEHRVEVENEICLGKLKMIHPYSLLGSATPLESLIRQYQSIIRKYEPQDPRKQRPAA